MENQLLLEFEHNAHHKTENDWPNAQEGRSSKYFLCRSRWFLMAKHLELLY